MLTPLSDRNGNKLSSSQVIAKIGNRFWNILLEFDVYILHLTGAVPIHHFRRAMYRLGGMTIGKGTTIHMGTRFYDPRNIKVGKDTVVGENAVLDGREKLVIGNHVAIASDVMIYNSHHDIHDPTFAPINAPVKIEDYVFIGPRSIILPGVTIGKGAVVAAGAVVTKDVAPMKVVGGVPAQVITERKVDALNYKIGRARWFR